MKKTNKIIFIICVVMILLIGFLIVLNIVNKHIITFTMEVKNKNENVETVITIYDENNKEIGGGTLGTDNSTLQCALAKGTYTLKITDDINRKYEISNPNFTVVDKDMSYKITLKDIGNSFTVALENSENGIVLYENAKNKQAESFLKSKKIDFFSDIDENWLPENLDSHFGGTHNGRNYIAYTFYIENAGKRTTNYKTTIQIDDVSQNIDEGIRITLFKNGSKKTYAKSNAITGLKEKNTYSFYNDTIVMSERTENFKAGDIDKYTAVIWLDGNDPDAMSNLIAGDIKIHMNFIEEPI